MMQIKFFSLFIILSLISDIKLDCGCDKTSREERSAKYERKTEGETSTLLDLSHEDDFRDMTLIPGGSYAIGTNEPVFEADKEGPERQVLIEKFYLDKFETSNKDFKDFVDATDYKTEAENFGDSFVFKSFLSEETQKEYEDFRVVTALWWFKIKDASWKNPEGIGSSIADRMDHPVVHVSWNDANAFCKWKNKRLPTEAEWETACRGGRKGKLYPWGNKLNPKDEHWMNIWQGEFPDNNSVEDGSVGTCAVSKFPQNSFDLHNIVGNVWEWTSDLWDESEATSATPNRVKKGGSYLCHESYCFRYRCAARSQNTQDSSAGNLGFRCAKDFH